MNPTPVDLSAYRYTLPYSAENYGLYQPLMGWRSERTSRRIRKGLTADIASRFTDVAETITPSVTPLFVRDGVEITTGRPQTDADHVPPAEVAYHVVLEVKRQFTDDGVTRPALAADPTGWRNYLSPDNLNELLKGPVPARIAANLEQAPPSNGGDLAAVRVQQSVGESIAAGTLCKLAEEADYSTLLDIFFPQSASPDTTRQRELVAMLDPLETFNPHEDWDRVSLSPIGIVHLFRQYFFEFDSFLGSPVQHIWLSPGGTVELMEVSTRRSTVEQTIDIELGRTSKNETTDKTSDELSEAVKTDNEKNLRIGSSVTANQKWGWGSAQESGSLDYEDTQRKARESTHKTMREQTTTLSSEIRSNFKSTFRTVTETEDTTSKRYVLANNTDQLVNYELRRKMRQVGVQVQQLGAQLCWQTYVDDPAEELDVAQLLHVAAPPDTTGLQRPDDVPVPDDCEDKVRTTMVFWMRNREEYYHVHGEALCYIPLNPPPGFAFSKVSGDVEWHSEDSFTLTFAANQVADNLFEKPPTGPYLTAFAMHGNSRPGQPIIFDVPVTYTADATLRATIADQNKSSQAAYSAERTKMLRDSYLKDVIDRVEVAAGLGSRSDRDLREEERTVIYRKLIRELCDVGVDLTSSTTLMHNAAELIGSIFDVDAMLYFVAPDYWWPHRYAQAHKEPLVPPPAAPSPGGIAAGITSTIGPMTKVVRLGAGVDSHVLGWPDRVKAGNRGTYYVTQKSAPAALGSSLGWLLQLDGDDQRNAFLNAPWVKAVLPIRPGKEIAALNWLSYASVEGSSGLDDPYQPSNADELSVIAGALEAHPWTGDEERQRYANFSGKLASTSSDHTEVTIRDALRYLAIKIQNVNRHGTDVVAETLENGVALNYLRPDMVFERGFDPLKNGFRATATDDDEFVPFDQWTEVLPTDQIVAVEVEYDPKSGRQIDRSVPDE